MAKRTSSAPAHVPADVADNNVTSEPKHENPRAFVPEPMPLAEAVEIPLPIHRGGLLRALSFLLCHQMRTIAVYVPALAAAVTLRPKQTAIALGVYWGVLCPRLAWQNAVHKWLAWASSNKPRFLNCMRQKAYDPSKQYVVAVHPHGFLGDNIINILARGCPELKTRGIMAALPGMGPATACVAPAVSWYPLYESV